MSVASGSSYRTVDWPLDLVAFSKCDTIAFNYSTGGKWLRSLGGLENMKNASYYMKAR